MLDSISYGRKDATKEEADELTTKSFATESYAKYLQTLGFDEAEIVALASVDGFGTL